MRKTVNMKKWIVGVVFMLTTFVGVGQDIGPYGAYEQVFDVRAGQLIDYDTTKLFCLGLNITLEGKKVSSDSIKLFIQKRNSDESAEFTVCEQVKALLLYDTTYLLAVTVKDFCIGILKLNTRVPRQNYNAHYTMDLLPGKDIKGFGWIAYDADKKRLGHFTSE